MKIRSCGFQHLVGQSLFLFVLLAPSTSVQSFTYLLIASVLMMLRHQTLIDSQRCVVTYTGVVRRSWSSLFAVPLICLLLTSVQLSARRSQHLSLPRNPGTTSHVLIAYDLFVTLDSSAVAEKPHRSLSVMLVWHLVVLKNSIESWPVGLLHYKYVILHFLYVLGINN